MRLFFFIVISILLGCSSTKVDPSSRRLLEITQDYVKEIQHLNPYFASYFGVEEGLAHLGDYPSPAYFEREKKIYETALHQLDEIEPGKLNKSDLRTYKLFKRDMEFSIKALGFHAEHLEFNQMRNRLESYLDDTSQSLTTFPFNSVKHYDDFLKRGEEFPRYIDIQIDFFKESIRKKVTLNCIAAKATRSTYIAGLETAPEKHPFYRPIGFIPNDFPEKDKIRLASEYKKLVQEKIIPGFQKFDSFFRTDYLPNCRKDFGIANLPNGKAWYAFEIEQKTGLPLTATEVHKMGLEEVARTKAAMEQIKEKANFKGSLGEFQKYLKDDERFQFKSAPEMIQAFEQARNVVNEKVSAYFNQLPESPYKIVESANPEYATASYRGPTENLPYGRLYLNTINLKATSKIDVNTLSMHEAVPGHHLQQSLEFEAKGRLSEYQRKFFSSVAFAEGWGLYAEYLGNEMGMYVDPYQKLGNLNYEMLRAVRLVVDTGIHAYGWSAKKATKYMKANLPSWDEGAITNEINRYSIKPAQALGYKIGQLKIIELRKRAEKELGSKFDLREFHQAVLENGTVSLPILEEQINDWIAEALRK